MRIVKQSVELESITPNAVQLIERAGRTCYKSEDRVTDDSAEAFVKMILKRGHHSVIEHAAQASFRVICDRGVSHEFVRHRLMSFSQESTRYCNYAKGKFGGEIAVIELGFTGDMRRVWEGAMLAAETAYLSLVEAGAPPQFARSVLPTCLKTELVATANFREWRHFLKLRTAPAAHPQMREVAYMIADILLEHARVCFEDVVSPER
uniref:Putative thymidylate synthase n=1 Tax=viral metagenome TaxID=1070528 RepID=A0A6H1Z7T7_9ZZZZ